VTGRFCSACGAAAGPRACSACQAPLSVQAHFCHRCGQAAAGARASAVPGARSERTAWTVAGVAVALLLLFIVVKVLRDRPTAAVPDMANVGNAGTRGSVADAGGGLPTGRAPDISQLSPAERFVRLNNRIMDAASRGDTATVVNFTPMAIGAYSQLDTVSNDERYHAAVLHAQIGQTDAARALTDTMLIKVPGYLLAYVVRGDIAGFEQNTAALRAAYADFRKYAAAQRATRRAEYVDHADIIDDFARKADAAK
ncbi:MAG: zinc ribbon domain-containing protein, partial [Gemmatimonadota bacterium]